MDGLTLVLSHFILHLLNKMGYSLKARYFPAIISILPIVTFNYFYLAPYLAGLLEKFNDLSLLVSNVSIPAIALYLVIQLNRITSKELFEKRIFKDELHMPTTNLLLFSTNFLTNDCKQKLRKKIYEDFNIQLPNEQSERRNPHHARKMIVEAMSQIRLRVKNGRLVLQHNIEYGFVRNLLGGSITGAIIATWNLIFFDEIHHNSFAFKLSAAMLIFYVLILLFNKILLEFFGYNYAKVLINEYQQT
mgnify:FL=1